MSKIIWVPYKKGSSAQESLALADGLKAQGIPLLNLHQGAEAEALFDNLDREIDRILLSGNTPARR